MQLSDEDARTLYSDASVLDYVAERVHVQLSRAGETLEATCYNLPPGDARAGTNAAYAAELSRLAQALGFDPPTWRRSPRSPRGRRPVSGAGEPPVATSEADCPESLRRRERRGRRRQRPASEHRSTLDQDGLSGRGY